MSGVEDRKPPGEISQRSGLLDRVPMLAPFRVRALRFQWPADLLTNCAFEMETIILGWWIYTETGSVWLLTAFGALHFFGTVVAPVLGVVGDRIGQRRLLAIMRAIYTGLGVTTLLMAATGRMTPTSVFVVASLMACVRTSDISVRTALVADMVPPGSLTAAVGFSRTTGDVARIAGALTGASLFAMFGIERAYLVIVAFYALGCGLTLAAAYGRAGQAQATAALQVKSRGSAWRDLREGLAYVWTTPHMLAGMWLAVLVNLTAFPFSGGLMPYLAREVYGVDKIGLGYLVASWATGAFIGSISLSAVSPKLRLGRVMIIGSLVWHAMLLGLSQTSAFQYGLACLMLAGFAQSFSMVALAAMLVRTSDLQYRGRVMGVRSLATYSLPIGLLGLGAMLGPFGFRTTTAIAAVGGIALTLAIVLRWRGAIWSADAPANRR